MLVFLDIILNLDTSIFFLPKFVFHRMLNNVQNVCKSNTLFLDESFFYQHSKIGSH